MSSPSNRTATCLPLLQRTGSDPTVAPPIAPAAGISPPDSMSVTTGAMHRPVGPPLVKPLAMAFVKPSGNRPVSPPLSHSPVDYALLALSPLSMRRRSSGCSEYSDRLMPIRNEEPVAKFNLHREGEVGCKRKHSQQAELDLHREEAGKAYAAVLQTELANEPPPSLAYYSKAMCPSTPTKTKTLLTYRSPSNPNRLKILDHPRAPKYSTTPIKPESQMILSSPKKPIRKIPKVPYKVLDAPDLQDDFYLNLLDWSTSNYLGVGLGSCVYLWNAGNSKVIKLCDLGSHEDLVTSVSWSPRGSHIAIGTNTGIVQIWDAAKGKKVRSMKGHSARVGSLAWNGDTLTSGSRDRNIFQRDVRMPSDYTKSLKAHVQEVCGLKWSPDGSYLASGGNDNNLFVWDRCCETPLCSFSDHTAAVKAIAWSPHQHGLLASGGGTADRRIRFWNTLTGTHIRSIDTGSQVCNLAWAKHVNELVSTHGYSQNQIVIWKAPQMEQIAILTGHTYRVLYLAMSPDGQNIVTGAGDETLRFWNVFNKMKPKAGYGSGFSALAPMR
ncbi:cell cycle regulatory protein [Polychytrium aggregatum]|uniref:cell cycle regulatory protein n=1 Tax=Polychytrium aggregatum TaxID=110093 RepID=UPI0022FF278E|nr:cell cycle regulatory protein [Polychytrium aggregatum]KAI9207079.1 cell cycle regulatory protein [Polychytrium aggregatum]